MKEPYSVLGITPNATDEEVTKAYKELAKKYHPDNFQNSPLLEFANEKMQEINEAYDLIRSNAESRVVATVVVTQAQTIQAIQAHDTTMCV